MKRVLISLLFTCFAMFVAPANATRITIVNQDGPGEGFNLPLSTLPVPGNSGATVGEQYLNVFKAAAEYWETKIDSSIEIRVGAQFNPLTCGARSATLGAAGPNSGFANFPNTPSQNTIYISALANSLAGQDLDPPSPDSEGNDLSAVFNSSLDGNPNCLGGITWWLGIDSPAPARTISLYDTVLHEIGHGVGFLSLVRQDGSRIRDSISGQDLNDPFSNQLFDLSLNRFWPNMSNAERQRSSTNTGNLVWRGLNVASGAGVFTGGRRSGFLRMFAPSPFQQGSSVSHWDTVLSPDELMEPSATPTSDSCATILALRDIGWRTMNECSDAPASSPIISPILPLLLDD